MYCNKKNVNILTALLVEHGVRHVVVCPGSRNAPLVHNFSQCDAFVCHPATDERSAGFIALGLRQVSGSPVAVCVTSGSALLNLMPAVAEASYQHQGIIVVSADRPAAWIDQLDGQTLPQQQALGCFVAMSVSLPDVNDYGTEEAWHCNRLVNEAMLANKADGHPSVHINVPLSEPLFDFSVTQLPEERVVRSGRWSEEPVRESILKSYHESERPMVVIGHMPSESAIGPDAAARLLQRAVILSEPVSMEAFPAAYTDQMLTAIDDIESYKPDWVLFAGGHTVSKRLRKFLRALGPDTMQILVSEDGRLRDISQHTDTLIVAKASDVLSDLSDVTPESGSQDFVDRWNKLRAVVAERQDGFEPEFSQLLAVKEFEGMARSGDALFYYANSMSVRLAAVYAKGYCQCNRGVNGIEGSLSVAAGASLAEPQRRVYCVTGDLSFFYDQNALWQRLGGNFRVLLLNNCQGAIFRTLPGLDASPVRDSFISGGHRTSARGACQEYGLGYRQATDASELVEGLRWLVNEDSDGPMLLEVCTDAGVDENEYKRLYRTICGQ